MRARATTLTVLCCLHALTAQDLTPHAQPQTRDVVLENAVVHTVAFGTRAGAAIHFSKGKIVAVAADRKELATPANTEFVDLKGKHVYPGLVGAYTQIGLVEIGQIRATVDQTELGPMAPEALASVAVNPDSAVIPVTRSAGVLAVGVFPLGDVVTGRASVIQLEGWTAEQMTVRADAGLVVTWPGMRALPRRFADFGPPRAAGDDLEKQRKKKLDDLEELIGATKAYLAARKADPKVPVDLRFEGLTAAVTAKVPVFVHAVELEQMQSAIAWGKRHGLSIVLVGARDADLCLDLLAREKVAVIVLGTHTLPRRAESSYDEPFKLPALLEDAGVPWCLATGEEHAHERNLPQHAATAVAFGLDKEAALRAITLSAARILGVGERLGSIETGKDATLFVCDGDPLEVTTRVERAWIAGRALDLSNKQTKLAEKYRARYR